MVNNTVVVTQARTERVEEVKDRTVYFEARLTNPNTIAVSNRDMPFQQMKHLIPGQWFAISCEYSERIFVKSDPAGTAAASVLEYWYEDI